MPHYKIHILRDDPRNIDRSFQFEARNDDEAVSTVQPASGDVPLELWCGERIVQRFAI